MNSNHKLFRLLIIKVLKLISYLSSSHAFFLSACSKTVTELFIYAHKPLQSPAVETLL